VSISLSKRQEEILHQVKTGATNKHIARRLNIAESTVKAHVGSLLSKFGVKNRSQLAIFSTPGYTLNLPVPPALEEKPVGWVKRVGKDVRGVVFAATPPDDTWDAIYIKRN
jgi:DNA-binding CsgD family transcriptional regulator